jgi:hypothetical protein
MLMFFDNIRNSSYIHLSIKTLAMKFSTWFFSVAVVFFHSCYYSAQVVRYNKSGTDKSIYVLYPAGHRPITATDTHNKCRSIINH